MFKKETTINYLKIVFVILLITISFNAGKRYERLQYLKSIDLNMAKINIIAKHDEVPDVSGYYIPPFGDGSTYLLLKQTDNQISVNGYTSTANLAGDLNIGEFSTTTNIDGDGIAKINLSTDKNEYPCDMYLIFFHQVALNEIPPYESQGEINSVRVFETNSGSACGFGNNVSFELENKSYEKQKTTPLTLPTSKDNLP